MDILSCCSSSSITRESKMNSRSLDRETLSESISAGSLSTLYSPPVYRLLAKLTRARMSFSVTTMGRLLVEVRVSASM